MRKKYVLYVTIGILAIAIIYWIYPSRFALVKEDRWNLFHVSNDIDGDAIPNKWDNCPEKDDPRNDPSLCSEDFSIAASIIDTKAGPGPFDEKRFYVIGPDGKRSDLPTYHVLVKSLSRYREDQYIIRPRWDNINLKMTCNGNETPKRCVLWDAIVLGCPEDTTDPKTDVVKLAKGSSYETELRLTDNFVFEKVDFDNKRSIACTIEGVYVTKGIKDPSEGVYVTKGIKDPSKGFSKNSNVGSEVCLGADGRIHLIEIEQYIEPMRITLNRK